MGVGDEGCGQGCSRRGQPTRAGALLCYKSPSTQLESVKGCAHPAESATLGGRPAPHRGLGVRAGVCLCAYMCACLLLCTRACVLVCLYVLVCAYPSMHVCGESIYLWILLCAICLHILFVTECVYIHLFVPICAVCVPMCVCGC